MAGMVADYMTIKRTQAEYQKENIQYNRTAMAEEIKRLFPNDTNINVDDPKYANIVKDLPYAPTVMGGLAESFGIARASLSTDLWEDLSHGYIPVDRIPANSDLHIRTVDTPRGKLVACNQTSSPMDTTGKYQSSGKSTAALEFVFGLGGNINKTLARMASKDPSVNKKIKKITDAIFENYIVPKMLEDAKVRHGAGGLDLKPAKEISAVSFFHIENRSVEPYYHFHFDLMNMARGYDGNLNALATGSIAKEKDSYNYLFQSEMKLALEKEFGFVFEAVYSKKDNANENLKDHEKNIVSFDLSDEWVPENVRQYYSQRSEEMDKAKNGKEGFIAEELARLKSRAGKSHLSPSEMFEMWNKEMDTMGWSIDDVKAKQDFNYRRPNVQSVTDEQLIDNYLRKVHNQHTSKYGPVQCFTEPQIAQLTLQEKIALASGFSDLIDEEQLITNFYRKHGEISFSESQFKSHIARQLLGDFDKDLAFRHAERMFNEQCVQLMDKSKIAYYESFIRGEIDDPDEYKQKQIRWNSELQFTTKSVLNKERYISESLLARTNETAFIFDREEVKNFIMKWEERKSVENGKPFAFKDGQKNAIIVSLTEPGAYANISGRAGSGKSTLLECIKDFIEPKGFNVFGTSISSTATENVQEAMKLTDVNARNVAKTIIDIESGKLKFTNKTLIVIDEMGMIDLDQAYKLIKYANESGAKILGCGEKEQLQSVGYGSTYRILNDQFITAEVKEINRQADDWQRQMVEKFAVGNSKGSMQDLFKNGKIIIEKTADDATQKLVSDYIADTTNGNNKLILTSTNWDRNRINEEVRKELKTQGKLSIDPKNAVTIECRDKEKREFVIGDRVVFTKNFKSSDNDKKTLKNSQTGELIGFRMSRFNKGKADAMIY
jgi:energy-coupling factor transporter ATP-binding protein EcfA2